MSRILYASFALLVIAAVVAYLRQPDDLPGGGEVLAPRDELAVMNGG